jgi:hypothetical protein
MSRESIDIVEQAEHEQFELTSLDPRSVGFCPFIAFPSLTPSCGSDNALDEDEQDEQRFRLMVYDLPSIAAVLAMIFWKWVSSFRNPVVISSKAEVIFWSLLGIT